MGNYIQPSHHVNVIFTILGAARLQANNNHKSRDTNLVANFESVFVSTFAYSSIIPDAS